MPADETALHLTAETLASAERSGDDLALNLARCARAAVLLHRDDPDYGAGLALFEEVRDTVLRDQFSHSMMPYLDTETAWARLRRGDLDGAIELSRTAIDEMYPSGESIGALATAAVVEALLSRGGDGDFEAAQAALDRSEALPMEDLAAAGLLHLRLRALIALAKGDQDSYRDFADRYLTMATSLGYSGHIAAAEAMT
jgi:adenylate cyclase